MSPNAGPRNICNIRTSSWRQGSLTKLPTVTWQATPGAVASSVTPPGPQYLDSKAGSTLTSYVTCSPFPTLGFTLLNCTTRSMDL